MKPHVARYALVCFRDGKGDHTLPCCITLDALPNAEQRGALIIAREWDFVIGESERIDPSQSNPRRHDDEREGDSA